MKSNSIYLLAFITGIIFFISCKKINPQLSNNTVTLYTCSAKTIEPYICFDSLIQDSRCPTGGECVWQGTAQIKISLHERNHIYPIKMELRKFPFPGYTNDTTINGYRIIFLDLKPYPDLSKPAPTSTEIKAFFNISQ